MACRDKYMYIDKSELESRHQKMCQMSRNNKHTTKAYTDESEKA